MSYPSVSVAPHSNKDVNYTVNNNVAVRMTFGPERNWDFDWTQFDIASGVCVYDFPSYKMWEVTWGYDFEHRNGGAPVFTMQSDGGLVSLNGGALPSYMNSSWHWIYPTEGNEMHYTYGFANGATRTVDVTFDTINGCQVPNIVWNYTPNKAPVFSIDPTTTNVHKLSDARFVITDETGVAKSQVNIRNASGESVEKYIRPNGANNAISLVNVAGNVWKLNMTGMNDNLPDGQYEFRARSVDTADKVGYSSWTGWVTLDNTAPRSFTAGLSNYLLSTSTGNPYLTGTITDSLSPIDHVNYAIWARNDDGSKGTIIKNWTNVPAADGAYDEKTEEFNTQLNLNLANLNDGKYIIGVRGFDSAQNKASAGDFVFTVDNTAPSTPSITKPTARQWFNTASITTNWTAASDTNGVNHYQVAYHYDDNHSFGGSTCAGEEINGVTLSGCRDVAGTSRSHTPGLNEEGGVTIWVRAIDNAGNVGPWSKSVHYYYDHNNPLTNIVAPTGTVGNSFTVSGDATDNLSLNRVYVQLVNRQNNQRYGGTTINLIGNGTNAHWSKTYDAGALNLPDGDYAAHVAVVDMAGNTSSAGWTDNFTVDTTKPDAPILSVTGLNSGDVTNQLSITATWNKPSTDTVSYEYQYWNDIAGNAWKDFHPWQTSVTGESRTGDFTEGEGTHFIRVRAIDHVGNASDWSNTFEVTYDKTAPVVVIGSAVRNSDGTYTITGTTDDTVDVVVSVDGVMLAPVTPVGNTWQVITGVLADGDHEVTASSTDAANNTGDATPLPYVFTATTPVVPTTTDNNDGNGSDDDDSSTGNGATNNGSTSVNNTSDDTSDDSDVLGTSTQKNDGDNSDVLGTTETAKNDGKGWSLFDLAWYWWLLVLAVIAFVGWLIATLRRRAAENV